LLILEFALAGLAAGCVRRPMQAIDSGEETPDPAPEPTEVRDVDVAYDGVVVDRPESVTSVPLQGGARRRVEPALFHLGAGYGALGGLDLASCRERGLQAGYLRMRVTFRSSGHIVHAAVQSSMAPPPEALMCIGEQLEVAMVPTFEGDDVTLSKSFFVN